MGLFDELDVASAADNPWAIPDNTYPAVVSKIEVKPNKAGDMAMYFYYKITEGDHADFEVSEYKRMPSQRDTTPLSTAEAAKSTSYIKQRLASLGIPESRMNSVDQDDLVGIECYISTQVKNDFVNVRSVRTTAPEGASTSSVADPFGV